MLRGTFSDKYDWQNVLMNIQQKPNEKVRPFSVRLRVAARKCGFQGPTLDNMCVNYLKRSCVPYLRTVLGNCLPGTPYDVIVEHAIQHERSKELEQAVIGERKSSKRKSDDLDEITDTANQSSLEKKIKQDYTNTIKQLKDQMANSINNLTEIIEGRSSKPHSSNNNKYQNDTRTNLTTSKKTRLNACLHCAKPNHRYVDCRSASPADKNAITQLLKERKFDFAKLGERAEAFLNNRRSKTEDNNAISHNPLNQDSPTQSGN